MDNLRVLLADSDPSFRSTAQRALTRQGYLVIPAENKQDALNVLAADRIDLVIANVDLSNSDGMDLLHAAKEKANSPPVILVAEPGAASSAEAGLVDGARDYIVKPVDDIASLVGLVDKAVDKPAPLSPGVGGQNAVGEAGSENDAAARLLEAASSGQELGHLLAQFALEIARLARAQQAVVLLAHTDGQLHVAAAYGFADRAEAGRAFVQLGGEEFAYRVAAARDVVEVDGHAAGAQEAEPGKNGLVGFPLLYAQELLGVAVVFSQGSMDSLPASTRTGIRRLTQQASLGVEMSRVRGLADHRNPTDPITGLLNREHFFDLADREFRRSWRFGERIAALQLDVDDLSKLRLLLGAGESDEILRQVSRAVHLHVRNIDVVGRLDTDKLGILLLNANREVAMAVADRLRRAVAEIELPTPEGTWQVTASIGVAVYPREQCASVHDLFGLAAQATRAAKRAGRNRAVGV